MRQIFFLLIFTLAYTYGNSQNRVYESIKFKNKYKFSFAIENKVKKDTTPWKYQMSAASYANKGDYKNALKHWDLAMHTRKRVVSAKKLDSIAKKYKTTSAVDFIVEKAKKHQIVIINEAHHSSLHRVFTKSLLQKLYNQGYRNLGLEALANGKFLDSSLAQRKYPTFKTGFYTREPQFGDLVRTALEIGYRLFAYEGSGRVSGKPREISQAKNIQKEIALRPQEKFLIHCGFAHVLEGKYKAWEKAMAGRLSEYTGLNPLTINQVVYNETSQSGFNHPLLRALKIYESVVLLDQNKRPYPYKRGEASTDLIVVHPETTYRHERPSWLFKGANKKVKIHLNSLNLSFPVMVLAFKQGEDIQQAIPLDIIEISDKKQVGFLALRKGAYHIVVANQANEARKFNLKVK